MADHQPKFLSVFTPSQSDPEDLEKIFVQRHALLDDAVERIRESATSKNKHYLLFWGARGSGKTHLVTLLVHRLGKDEALEEALDIAWLNEDETSTSLLELLIKVYHALMKRYPERYPAEALDPIYELTADLALERLGAILKEHLGKRTLLIVAENLDALFDELKEAGQKELRAFAQENPFFCMVATAQRLVSGLTDRKKGPFFGFFQTEHLKPLDHREAGELLRNIAQLNGQTEVAAFLSTARGKARIRALHHLSGGNHRIYLVLSQFITKDTIDALVTPFRKMVDELTPYYQERVRWLPPLQRKIVEHLCRAEGTVPVKEIAKALFSTHQTISKQLKELREKGYIESSQRGRESLYDIREPMMRICVEVKENQSYQPLKLLVDFIRVWYDSDALVNRLGTTSPEALHYLQAAIAKNASDGNLRREILVSYAESLIDQERFTEFLGSDRISDLSEPELLVVQAACEHDREKALGELSEDLSIDVADGDTAENYLARALIYRIQGEIDREITEYTAVVELENAIPDEVARALFKRGFRYGQSGDDDREIADYTAIVELEEAPPDKVAKALVNRGVVYGQGGDNERAIAEYTAVIRLDDVPPDVMAKALVYRGVIYGQRGDNERAIADFTDVIELDKTSPGQVAEGLVNRGVAFGKSGESERAIADYTAVIELDDVPPGGVAEALSYRGFIYGRIGESERAIADYTAVIELENAHSDIVTKTLVNRGAIYGQRGDNERAISDYTAIIENNTATPEQMAKALFNRGFRYGLNGDNQRAITDYTAVIELDNASPEPVAGALFYRGAIYSQGGDYERAITDYTAVIELDNAPPEAVAEALVNRGVAYSGSGDSQRTIADCTAIIGLDNVHSDQVARAFLCLGFAYGQSGDRERAIASFAAVVELDNATPEQVAKALVNRGVVYLQTGDNERAVADFTAVIDFDDAPPATVSSALLNRGAFYVQSGDNKRAIADYTAVIEPHNATPDQVVDAYLALAEVCFVQRLSSEGLNRLDAGIRLGVTLNPPYCGSVKALLAILYHQDIAAGSMDLDVTISQLVRAYIDNRASEALGEALIQHLGDLHRTGKPLSPDQLAEWQLLWEEAAADIAELELPLRIFQTGIAFLMSEDRDESILLDLRSGEREILQQALGLSEK